MFSQLMLTVNDSTRYCLNKQPIRTLLFDERNPSRCPKQVGFSVVGIIIQKCHNNSMIFLIPGGKISGATTYRVIPDIAL